MQSRVRISVVHLSPYITPKRPAENNGPCLFCFSNLMRVPLLANCTLTPARKGIWETKFPVRQIETATTHHTVCTLSRLKPSTVREARSGQHGQVTLQLCTDLSWSLCSCHFQDGTGDIVSAQCHRLSEYCQTSKVSFIKEYSLLSNHSSPDSQKPMETSISLPRRKPWTQISAQAFIHKRSYPVSLS